MALKLKEFTLKGDVLELYGCIDPMTGNPVFDIRFVCGSSMMNVKPEDMNVLINRMEDEIYGMKVPNPVKCEDGSTYFFTRDSVIERFMKDNAEEVNACDRAQEGPSGRENDQ